MKPKTAEGVVVAVTGVVDAGETDTELDELSVEDDEMEVEMEADAESGRAEPVGIPMEVTMVLAASLAEIPTEGEVPDASAAQPVANTVTVDTRVTVTMLSVPMTTVGVTTPFDAEEVEAAVGVLEVLAETELGSKDVELELATDEVGTAVEVDEIDKS